MSTATLLPTPALKSEGLALMRPLATRVEALEVTSPETYEDASRVLADVRSARARWDAKITPSIDGIRKGLDGLYALRREVDDPLKAMETAVKGEMSTYDLKLLAARRQAEAEAQRLQLEAERQRQKAAELKTAPAKARLVAAAEATEARAETAAERAAEVPLVKASGSRRRIVVKWRVDDLAQFIEAMFTMPVGAVEPPLEAFAVVKSVMDAWVRERPEVVAAWPGVSTFEVVEIAGR